MNPVINRLTLATITAAIPLTGAAPLARAQDAARITAIEFMWFPHRSCPQNTARTCPENDRDVTPP